MSNPIRCPSTNDSIGEYYAAYMALNEYITDHPTGKQMIDYLRDFGISNYPQIMRIITNIRFIDAHRITNR